MTTCTRMGCGQPYTDSPDAVCTFHPGAPVFHEGRQSWSCCNKKAYSFDEFLAIPGCATGTHSLEKPTAPAPKPTVPAPAPSSSSGATESYGAPTPAALPVPSAPASKPASPAPTLADVPKPQSTAYVEEQDDLSVTPAAGATCKRKACGKQYADGLDRETDVCTYHPGAPIFHEGSKGWSCCKRRVME